MHFLILFFSVFRNVLQGAYFMPFVLYNLHMNNLTNDTVSTIKQFVDDVLLSFITLNAKN